MGMFPGLSKGCINTLLSNATDELQEKYVPQLVSGEWAGTMCLTEPVTCFHSLSPRI